VRQFYFVWHGGTKPETVQGADVGEGWRHRAPTNRNAMI
jgi:hypothetical protein